MAYEGYVDFADEKSIRGWVFDSSAPDAPLMIEIVADGIVIARHLADEFREDLLQLGKGNGRHGFSFAVRNPGPNVPLRARIEGKRWSIRTSFPTGPRRHAMILHSLEYGLPVVSRGFSEPTGDSNETAILTRLIAAYDRAIQEDPAQQQAKDDMWSGLKDIFHGELIRLLRDRNLDGLGSYLRDAHNRGITFGITQGPVATESLRSNPAAAQLVASQFMDYFVSLAEYLAVLDVEAPEQHGQWAENLHSDPEQLLAEIETRLGVPVVPPNVLGSLFGLATSRGILSGRDLTALYAAIRIRDILQQNALDSDVCEIGGGLGGVAYYSTLLGVRNYTIIDLPLVNVLQGYYLLRALPDKAVSLYGEQHTASSAVLRILPAWEFERSQNRYSVLFNMDSIPEMHIDYALGYLRRARHNVQGYFLSINQEAQAPQSATAKQTAVRNLTSAVKGYERLYRFRHWLRCGYIEELYRISALADIQS